MPAVRFADTRQMPREEWLTARRQGIGGSDAAAILGLDPWKSALAVYYEKIDGRQGEDSLAMELGRELEPFLRRKFQQWLQENEGCQADVRQEPFILQHSDYPFLLANIDGWFTHPELGPCGLELKTAGEFQREHWDDDEIPDRYYIQVQHYLAVTGLHNFYIGYLIGNRLFNAKRVPRHETVIGELTRRLQNFWENHILAGVPPAPAGLDCDTDILKKLYPQENGDPAIMLPHMQEQYDAYKTLKKQEKELGLKLESIKQLFMSEMKEAQVALVGRKKITWKTIERKGYTVAPTSYRSLRIY